MKWIQTIWHSDTDPQRMVGKNHFEKVSRRKQKHEPLSSMQIVNLLLVLIWVKTVCKDYQQMIKATASKKWVKYLTAAAKKHIKSDLKLRNRLNQIKLSSPPYWQQLVLYSSKIVDHHSERMAHVIYILNVIYMYMYNGNNCIVAFTCICWEKWITCAKVSTWFFKLI